MQSFPRIDPASFVHEADASALEAMRAVPGLEALLRTLAASTIERQIHAERSLTAVKLGPAQYPSLYAMVERACAALDVPVPDAYLDTGYEVNAWAFGFQKYTITLYSGLVDYLSDGEIQAVVGHEIGHIACDHMLYKSAAWILSNLGVAALRSLIGGVADLMTAPIQLAMLRWSRAAELSCDRAALLVVQDPRVVASALARLGGASQRFRAEFSLAEVVRQAERYESNATLTERFFTGVRQIGQTHPDPILRAREILRWSDSAAYRQILAGSYRTRAPRAPLRIEGLSGCAICGAAVAGTARCEHCGGRQQPQDQRACGQGHRNDAGWRYCRSCGEALAAAP